MRPHTFVVIAALLYLLQNPKDKKNYFQIDIKISKGTSVEMKRSYQVYVDDITSNKWKMRVNRVDGQIAYYCALEIMRPTVGVDKFVIDHDHARHITEHFEVFSHSLKGEYRGHYEYKTFESNGTFDAKMLEIRTDFQDFRYKIENLR